MADTVEQIKSKLGVIEVVNGYVRLTQAGRNWKACCPFHHEKTPSFFVSPERQTWHCFGCAKGGDIFTFVQEIEGVDFPEALRILAQRAGVELGRFDPAIRSEKNRLLELCEASTRFFEKQLWASSHGKQALEYLRGRGLTDDTIRQFRLGFAPDDWYALTTFLVGRGFTAGTVIAGGLAIDRGSRPYDRFRSRITFPIADVNGQVVGFSARAFAVAGAVTPEIEPAKYINTPQTLIYDKSRVLYSLNHARQEIRQAGRCVLVEGNMDAIMSHQGGVKHAVATSGTALTSQQLQLLARYATTLDFCFDADQAGAAATRRGIALAVQQQFSVHALTLDDPTCKDPADYVQRHGTKWQELAGQAKPVIQYYLDRARQQLDFNTPEGKTTAIHWVAPLIRRLSSQVERSHWTSQLALTVHSSETAVAADVISAPDDLETPAFTPTKPTVAVPDRAVTSLSADVLSEALLTLVLKNPILIRPRLTQASLEGLDPSVAGLIAVIQNQPADATIDHILTALGEDGTYRAEFAYLKSQQWWDDCSDADLVVECDRLLAAIERKQLASQLSAMELDIRDAEATHNQDRLATLLATFRNLTERLARTHRL